MRKPLLNELKPLEDAAGPDEVANQTINPGWIRITDFCVLVVASMFLLRRGDDDCWRAVGHSHMVFPSFVVEELLLNGVLCSADGDDFGGDTQGDGRVLEDDLERVVIVETSAAGKRLLSEVSGVVLDLATLWRRISSPA